MSALDEAREDVHHEHSKGMPMGWVAALEKCENPKCVALRPAPPAPGAPEREGGKKK